MTMSLGSSRAVGTHAFDTSQLYSISNSMKKVQQTRLFILVANKSPKYMANKER